jgi:tetratricopeptide (TPR) repeat protein
MENYSAAESLFEKCLENAKNASNENDFELAKALNNLASVYPEKERYEAAESFLLQTLAILRATEREYNPNLESIILHPTFRTLDL